MKHRAKARVGRIEKFEDMSRELFRNLRRTTSMNCQAPRTIQRCPIGDAEAASGGREVITSLDKVSLH